MTTQVLFNQFAYTDRLKSGGFTDEQARASAEALAAALSETVATSSELAAVETRLNAKIDTLEAALTGKIDTIETTLNTKIDHSFLQLKLEIAKANNAMLIKTGSMLVFIVTAAFAIARYFGLIH